MPEQSPLSIGDLAKATGTKVVTIRYYERAGLLPPPQRTTGNYRVYKPAIWTGCALSGNAGI